MVLHSSIFVRRGQYMRRFTYFFHLVWQRQGCSIHAAPSLGGDGLYYSFMKRIHPSETVLRSTFWRNTFWSKALSVAKLFCKPFSLVR